MAPQKMVYACRFSEMTRTANANGHKHDLPVRFGGRAQRSLPLRVGHDPNPNWLVNGFALDQGVPMNQTHRRGLLPARFTLQMRAPRDREVDFKLYYSGLEETPLICCCISRPNDGGVYCGPEKNHKRIPEGDPDAQGPPPAKTTSDGGMPPFARGELRAPLPRVTFHDKGVIGSVAPRTEEF